MEILQVGAELLHTDRRTKGRTENWKPTVSSYNFASTPKNGVRSVDCSAEFGVSKQV